MPFLFEHLQIHFKYMSFTHHVQPQLFQRMRADLASMWSPSSKSGNTKRICERSGLQALDKKGSVCKYEEPVAIDEEVTSMKVSCLQRSKVFG